MENRADQEPKFYPCKMCMKIKTEKNFVILAPTLFESREQYLDFKRETIQACMLTGMTKQKQLELYWQLILETREKMDDEENFHALERLCLFIATSRATVKGEDIFTGNYWTKKINMDDFEADGKNISLCAGCNTEKKLEELSKCAGCKFVCYCSRECQKKHWKIHKKDCQESS